MRMSPSCTCCEPPECQHICDDRVVITTANTDVVEPTTLPAKWRGTIYLDVEQENRRGWFVLGLVPGTSRRLVLQATKQREEVLPGFYVESTTLELGELDSSDNFTIWPIGGPEQYSVVERFPLFTSAYVEFDGTTLEVFCGQNFLNGDCRMNGRSAWKVNCDPGPIGAGTPAGTPVTFIAEWSINQHHDDNANCPITDPCVWTNICNDFTVWRLTVDVTLDGQCYPLTSLTLVINRGHTACRWNMEPIEDTPCLMTCLQMVPLGLLQVLVECQVTDSNGTLLGNVGAVIDRPGSLLPIDCDTELDGLVLVPLDATSGGSLWGTSFSLTLSV